MNELISISFAGFSLNKSWPTGFLKNSCWPYWLSKTAIKLLAWPNLAWPFP
jgi:hypothetical protein